MLRKSDSIVNIAKAMCAAQKELESAKKSSLNPHFKSRYADLAEVIDVSKTIHKFGLSYMQPLQTEEDGPYLYTILMHESGEWVEARLKLLLGKNDMQGIIAASTYARRGQLSAILGIPQEDDDGNSTQVQQPKLTKLEERAAEMKLPTPNWSTKPSELLQEFKDRIGLTDDPKQLVAIFRESDKSTLSDPEKKIVVDECSRRKKVISGE